MSQAGSKNTSKAVRRRTNELLQAIHAAVLEEVAAVGVGKLTMEGIAVRAAAAKTSLYRRWSSPQQVLIDALKHLHPQESPSPSFDDLRGDLVRALQQFVALLAGPGGRAMAAVFAEGDRNPELVSALTTQVFEPHGGAFTRLVLTAYGERGAIDPEVVTPVVTDIGEALVLKALYETGRLPDEEYLEAIVEQAILPAVGFPIR